MDNRQIAELISERIGPRPVPFEAVRTLALEIYHDLGGREDDENFADIFEILLSILPLTNLIDDTSIYLDKTWSSYKIDASLNQVITRVEDLMNFDCSTIEPTTTNFVPGTEYTVYEALQRTANLFGGYQDEIDDINALIPGQATESNQLADKSFVNSTVATNAANFRGNWTNWSAVPTEASLYPEDYVGNRTPTNNDYMMVQDTSDYDGFEGSWRFIYVGDWNTSGKSGWNPQYKVGSTFTAVQQDAIDSGITATKVATYDGYGTSITALQTDKLDKVYTGLKIYGTDTLGGQISYEAGTGISFENGKISNTNTEAAWGNITGTLSNQTDLSTVLDSKQDVLTAGNNITINGTTISAKDTTYSASDNIDITNNAIKAVGYSYDTTNGAFAEGDRDIVEGSITWIKSTATGLMSHAEGTRTVASGTASHAEGYGTIAFGEYAHSEGGWATASGYASHAEGHSTEASGDYSHAEGHSTEASGYVSHAEGYYTNAIGSYSHSEGNKTVASGVGSHAEGYYTNAIGRYSHSEGYQTTASGENSHAEGSYATAIGDYSHAEGCLTIAQNLAEHAEGVANVSHKASNNNGDAGNTQHSVGIAFNDYSGNFRKNAFEIMQNGDAYLIGVGNYDGIHIKGETGAPSGLLTLQETVNGKQDALQVGNGIDITNNTISALGYEYNSDINSITNGFECVASGLHSHSEGTACVAYGENSHAEGYQCHTLDAAFASHAEGIETEAYNIGEHAQGKYNVSHQANISETQHEGNTIVSVGIGEGSDRKNAFEIMQNGDIYVYGLGNYNGTLTKTDDPAIMTLQDILKTIADALGLNIGALF